MQKYLRELHPTVFEDLIAMNALYRPGPMDYIPSFIARKNGREEIKYDIPCMEKYLKDTYGITVYQEQVMLLSRQLANFTRGQSDALRKAMGKKKKKIVDEMKPMFIEGGMKNGHDPAVLDKIWGDWEKFASYAFNKSHAACYSWVAFQTAYLKANYPAEFMAAIMSRRRDQITEITKLMDECKSLGIATLGPDVNESYEKFGVNKKGEIRFGLAAIKGLGDGAALAIIEEREKNGLYKDIYDFAQRVNIGAVNRKAFESLALSGGFDSFNIPRESFFVTDGRGQSFLDVIVRYGQLYQNEKAQAQNSLFGDTEMVEIANPPIPKAEAWSTIERLNRERELVGIYLSAHPLDDFSFILESVCNTHCNELSDLSSLAQREKVTLGGIVTGVRSKFYKNGKPYGVVTIEDFEGTGEFALFGEDWGKWKGLLIEGSTVFVSGKCQPRKYDEKLYSFYVSDIQYLQTVKDNQIENFTISFKGSSMTPETVDEISNIIADSPGNTELYFKITDTTQKNNVLLHAKDKTINVSNKLILYINSQENMSYQIN
jgi:DNA polymerase-3 subunit alpha